MALRSKVIHHDAIRLIGFVLVNHSKVPLNRKSKHTALTSGDKGTLGVQMFTQMTDGGGMAKGGTEGFPRQAGATCTP